MIAPISPRSLHAYHRGAYVGTNIVLAAAGNVDHDSHRRRCSPSADGPPTALMQSRKPAGVRYAPRCASIARTPSSTTSVSPARACGAMTRGGMQRRCSTRSSAARRRRRLFQEIREKRGMAYSVYTYGSHYTDAGQVGIYVGTREENLRECLDVIAAELQDVGAGNIRAGRARAGEGEHEGPHAAVARVDVGPDDASRQGDRDRHRDRPDRRDGAPDRRRHCRRRRTARPRPLCAATCCPRPASGPARSGSGAPSSASIPLLLARAA